MVRKATVNDIPGIVKLWLPVQKLYPKLRPDHHKQRKVLEEAVYNDFNYCSVVGEQGDITAALVALSSNHLWAQRKNSNIVIWESEDMKDGLALVDDFREWLKPRRGITLAFFLPDLVQDYRGALLTDRGFEKSGGVYILYN